MDELRHFLRRRALFKIPFHIQLKDEIGHFSQALHRSRDVLLGEDGRVWRTCVIENAAVLSGVAHRHVVLLNHIRRHVRSVDIITELRQHAFRKQFHLLLLFADADLRFFFLRFLLLGLFRPFLRTCVFIGLDFLRLHHDFPLQTPKFVPAVAPDVRRLVALAEHGMKVMDRRAKMAFV